MPSIFSPSLRLELIETGEQAANWGKTTNTNLGTLIEQAITGVVNVTVSGSPTTLVSGNGISDEARNAVLVLGGSPGGNADLIIPTAEKLYVVRNATTGGYAVTVKMATGTGVTVANGFTQAMYCDGTNVVLYTLPVRASDGSMGNVIATGATISGSSSTDLVRITQTGSGNALVVEDNTNPDATPFVIDNAGKLIAGYTGAMTFDGGAYLGNFLGAQATFTYPIVAGFTDASSTGPKVTLVKNRSADWSTQTPVVSGDIVGDIDFLASDGTNFLPGARIRATVDGTPGPNDLPTRMTFSTTADGAATPTERMRITSSGNVGVGTAAPSVRLDVYSTKDGNDGVYYTNQSTGSSAQAIMNVATSGAYGLAISQQYTTKIGAIYLGDNADLAISTNATERMRITADGKVGIGTTTPVAQVGFYGTGQATLGTFSTSGNLGGTLYVRDSGGSIYNGGAIMFGANQGSWAAIKSWLNDGSNNTNGGVSIYTRAATTDSTLTERVRVAQDGTLAFNSGFGSVGIAYGCRAWVNFNGVPATGTYSRTGTLITVTITGHGMTSGMIANLTFTTGAGTSGSYPVTVTGANTYTVTDTGSGTTSGNVTQNSFIRASGNVASISDFDIGYFQINFTNAMPDINYCTNVTGYAAYGDVATLRGAEQYGPPEASNVKVLFINGLNTARYDPLYANVSVFR